MLDTFWYFSVSYTEHIFYHSVVDCTYWPMLVPAKNWNMIKFNNKTKPIKYFDEIHKAVLDNISDNIASLI